MALTAACLALVPAASWAQSDDEPIAVTATEGIEWDQQRKVYIAKGDAAVKQGDVTIHAAELRAYYREGKTKKQGSGVGLGSASGSIHRIEAIGNVYVKLDKDQLSAGKIVYEVDKELMTATGNEPVFAAGDGTTVQASEALIYDPKNSRALAKGNVRAWDKDNRLNADELELEFSTETAKGPGGVRPTEIKQIVARGHVVIVQGEAAAQADRAIYDPVEEAARLEGNVRLVQDGNVLTGQYGEFFFKPGIGRILAVPPGTSNPGNNQRVFIVINPSTLEGGN
jgi:lipopolysaccharide export system protein LptA